MGAVYGQVPGGGEVVGMIGYGRFGDDEGSLGNGLCLGGGAGYTFSSRVGMEVVVETLNYSRDFDSSARFEGETLTVVANVLYYFSAKRTRPYVLGGVGLLHSTRRSEFRFEEGTERFSFTDDRWAFNLGSGVRIGVSERFAVRPEFRVLIGRGLLNVLQGSVGFVYDW